MSDQRQPLMEITDNSELSSPALASTARRSGRVIKAPEKYVPDAPVATKRKHAAEHDEEDVENESPDEDAEANGDSDAGESDAEEDDEVVKRPKTKRAPSRSTKTKKPAAKKPKINGSAPKFSNHASKHLPSRPKKIARLEIARRRGDELYAEIFGSGLASDRVASNWYSKYQEDGTVAVANLVNCILQAAGCDRQITADDIRDPDNCDTKLAELQSQLTEEGISEYPLISKTKGTRPFRDLLVGFFKSFVNVLHETDVLYKDTELMDNVIRWVASMSSSTLRPFRHTATTVALALETGLAEASKKLDERVTKMTQQIQAEQVRKGKNKERLQVVQQNLDEAELCNIHCHEQMKDLFDVVYVHRYRDVDHKIRAECVEALGTWIWMLPTYFLKPEDLRYLGWMLSDESPAVRHEVLKQLARIFRRDSDKLGHFIDRFRPRIVEMAIQDNDVNVRLAGIDVVGILKKSDNLEPEEVDSIGRLIFDSELRVRKAVVGFFIGCVNEAHQTKIEEMGGKEGLDDLFGDDNEDEFESPRRDWILIKCLGEMLAFHQDQLADEPPIFPRSLDVAVETIEAVAPTNRVSLASQVLYSELDFTRHWKILSGYLLYDHTTSATSNAEEGSNDATLRDAIAPQGDEESILLEVLGAAVHMSLTTTHADPDKGKKKVFSENSEDDALYLTSDIPRLLRKFGSDPDTALVPLRMVCCVDLEKVQHLRQDADTYTRLLDAICTQFDRHSDRGVVSAATFALMHARKYEELEELTDSKTATLWENVINSFRKFGKQYELSERGNMDVDALSELGNVLMKVSNLARITSCIDILEAEGEGEDERSPVAEMLVHTVKRGKIVNINDDLDDLEDEATSFAIKACHLYFMWKARELSTAVQNKTNVPSGSIGQLRELQDKYAVNVMLTLASRGINDDLRLFATGGLCDLYVAFAGVRQRIERTPDGPRKYEVLNVLFEPMRDDIVDELIEVFTAAETALAKRTKKKLLEPDADEDPVDDEDELLTDDDECDEAELTDHGRLARQLKAERVLCELAAKLIMAIVAKTVDSRGPKAGRLKKRMLRNRNKLGSSFREVLAYLNIETERQLRDKGRSKNGKGKKAATAEGKSAAKSAELVLEGDDDDDDEPNPFEDTPEPEEGTVEDRRRRGLLDEDEELDNEDGNEDRGGPSESKKDGVSGDESSVLGD